MSNARNKILSRLTHRASTVNKAVVCPNSNTLPDNHDSCRINENENKNESNDHALRLQQFIDQLKLNHADVYLSDNETKWQDFLPIIAEKHALKSWLFGSPSKFYQDAQNTLEAQSIQYTFKHLDSAFEYHKEIVFKQVDAGLTTAHSAIAESGTIVLVPNQQEPRILSLVPPVHIVRVNVDQIVDTFAQALSNSPTALTDTFSEQQPPSNILLITGPSKTADIQQVLAYGAHGPKALVVIIEQP